MEKHREGICWNKGSGSKKAQAKAETSSTRTATSAEPTVIEGLNVDTWMCKCLQRAKATKAKAKWNQRGG